MTTTAVRRADPEPTSGVTEALEDEAPKKVLSKAEKIALFELYDSAHKAVEALEKQLEDANIMKDKAVEAIFNGIGSGPFNWKGRQLTVAKKGKGEGYYFRGEKKREVEKIG